MRFFVVATMAFILLFVSSGANAGTKMPVPYEGIIQAAGKGVGVDPSLIKAVIYAESRFNCLAVSSRGAQGLMQLMPGTASEIGVRNPFDPTENILGGTIYLGRLLQSYGGNLRLAVAAYNAGASRVKDRVPDIKETREYVERVVSIYNYIQSVERQDGRYASR
jgi:soluble lytic murein transglycosylase-like protein